jgi:hypothetical protein
MQPSQRINYRPLIFVALAWLFAGSEIYKRVSIDLNGTIVSSETSCVQPANNRCATEYIVKSQDGSRHAYIAGTTDQALPRQLPVGTVVDKHKWSLSYAVSGQERRDSPMGFYSVILVLGLMCAIWWYAVLRHK